jgi:hypothetical protein
MLSNVRDNVIQSPPLYTNDNTSIPLVPNAKRIVYSTCSIHALENEHVVETILSRHPEFTLAPRATVLPTWKRRGFPSEMENSKGKLSWENPFMNPTRVVYLILSLRSFRFRGTHFAFRRFDQRVLCGMLCTEYNNVSTLIINIRGHLCDRCLITRQQQQFPTSIILTIPLYHNQATKDRH